MSTEQILEGYLFAYVVVLGLTLGCFGLTLLHHATRARWSQPVLRLWEAGSSLMWLMAVLFIPIALSVHTLYPWAKPDLVSHSAVLQHKAPYFFLTSYKSDATVAGLPIFFYIRAVIYFAIWIGLSQMLNRSSREQDRTGDDSLTDSRANWAAPGILLYFLTVNFAFTDWIMSLDPHWYSTIYGIWFAIGQALSATAFVTILVTSWIRHKPYSEVVTPRLTRDLGNLLLTLTLLWGYTSLSQWLIIYSGNLPEEITYYLNRLQGAWWTLGTVIVFGQFFVPFLALLSGNTKRVPALLRLIAIEILIVRVLDIFWVVLPFFLRKGEEAAPGRLAVGFVVLAGMGIVWGALFAAQLKKYPRLPQHGILLQEALEHA